MARLDYYGILGVSPNASDEDIKKAYRALVFQFHPDRNQGNSEAEVRIREINVAYEVLGNSESRRAYERLRFGGYGTSPTQRGEDVEEGVDPAVILRDMEEKLKNEARQEMLAALLTQSDRIKQELRVIRERIVDRLGYDAFREEFILERAKEIIHDVLPSGVWEKRERLLDVAMHMLVLQSVVSSGDESNGLSLRTHLQRTYDEGWEQGYVQACSLFYERR